MVGGGIWRLAPALACSVIAAPAHATPPDPFIMIPAPLPAIDTARESSVECLASAIVYEAAHEPVEGREAVAEVIMNRVRSPVYPKTVCGVVYQGSERRTGCQFTFTCDGSLRRRLPERFFTDARLIAQSALDGSLPDRVGGATHYHASYVLPRWAASLAQVGRIGAHIFYQASAGGRLAALPGALAQKGGLIRARTQQIAAASGPFLPWGLSLAASPSRVAATTN